MVVNTTWWQAAPGEKMLHGANLSFDATHHELWGPLLNGLTIVIADKATVMDPARLSRLIREHTLQHVFVTTALFKPSRIFFPG
jgi:non-ribosomal peptide synthetase component F